MALLNSPLTTPEAGWKRIESTDGNISYVGSWSIATYSGHSGGSSQNTTTGSTAKYQFNFTGTKIRLIGCKYTGGTTAVDVYVDGLKVTTFSQNGSNTWQTLDADIQGLTASEHYLQVLNTAAGYFWFDAIDIESAGVLKSYNTSVTSLKGFPQVI